MNNFQGILNKALLERLVETEDWVHLNDCGIDLMENIQINSDFDYVDKALAVSRYTHSMKMLDERGATEKSNAKSAKMREKANELFKKKKWLEALKLYSRSAAFAKNGSLELCFAYGNRSALLFHRGYYRECLEDIERALQMAYPEDKKSQLITRQQKAKELLPNQSKNIVPDDIPSLGSCNSFLKTATDAIKLTENEEYGRFVEATKDIRPGEIIAIENPYAMIVTQDYKTTNCGDCGKLCYNLIPCSRCSVEMYCSDKCKTNAYNAYHQYECIIMNFYPFEAFDVDAPDRDSSQMDTEIIRQLSLRITLKGFRNYMNTRSDQSEDLYQEVAKLQTHQNELNKSSKMLLAINCAKHFYTIKKYTNFLSKLQFRNKEDILKYHLLRNRLICCFNISHLLYRSDGVHDEVHVGYGLYPTYSMFNHSCVENVGYGFYGNTIVMRAKRTIRKGEQCFINYGYFYQVMPKKERSHDLQRSFFFSCKCEACANNWPIFKKEAAENNPELKSPALMQLEILKALYANEKYPTEKLRETVFKTCAEFENMRGPGIHLVSYYHLINIAMLTRYQGSDF